MGNVIEDAKKDVADALADGKKVSHNGWAWAAFALGLIIGFGFGKIF